MNFMNSICYIPVLKRRAFFLGYQAHKVQKDPCKRDMVLPISKHTGWILVIYFKKKPHFFLFWRGGVVGGRDYTVRGFQYVYLNY